MIQLISQKQGEFNVVSTFHVHATSLEEVVTRLKNLKHNRYRLSIDQTGCDSIILSSFEFDELTSELLECLLIEEGHMIHETFRLTVLGL